VGAENAVRSCDLQVFVDQSVEPVASKVSNVGAGRCWSGSSGWWLLIEGSARSVGVVLDELFVEDSRRKARVNLTSRSRIRNRNCSAQVHQQVAGLPVFFVDSSSASR
jgi:hypothetical protein